MSANDKSLAEKVSKELKKYKTLKKIFMGLFDAEVENQTKRKIAFKEMINVKENDNENLALIQKIFISRMLEFEEIRGELQKALINRYVPITIYIPEKLEKIKKDIKGLSDIKSQREKAAKEQEKARAKSDNAKANQLNQEILRKQAEESSKGNTIENNLTLLESERIQDNKNMIMDLILEEMTFHTRSIELLTRVYNEIGQVEPYEKLPDFLTNYNIKSVSLKDIKIDMNQIEKEKERRERERQEVKNQVFGNQN